MDLNERVNELEEQIQNDVKVEKQMRQQLVEIQKRIYSNKERLDELKNWLEQD